MARPEALEKDVWRDLRPLLDLELNRLPEKYREPVILCDLEGQTRKAAARRLGWPEGTLSGRLSRARVMLAKRLARHGLPLSGGAVAVVLCQNAASACMPALLVSSTVQAATLLAAGHAVAGAVSARVALLTEGVLKAMLVTKVKIATAVVLTVGLLGVGWGVYQTHAAAPPDEQREVNKAPADGGCAASAPATEDKKKDDAKEEEKINLPTGPALTQVLASLDKDGKLVVKTAIMYYKPVGGVGPAPLPKLPAGPGGGLPAGPGGAGGAPAGGAAHYEKTTVLNSQTYDLDDVKVLDTKGKKIGWKDATKLLKEETVAMASLWGQPVDPLHLRVLKDGTLTFILPGPAPAPQIGVGAPGLPGIRPPAVAPAPPLAPHPPGAAPPAPPTTLPGIPVGAPPAKPAPPGKP